MKSLQLIIHDFLFRDNRIKIRKFLHSCVFFVFFVLIREEKPDGSYRDARKMEAAIPAAVAARAPGSV